MLKLEGNGMQKNSEHFVNQQYFDDAKLLFEKYFQADICLTKQWISNDVAGMGPFYLEYKHLPSNYRIILECQMLTFVIVIKNIETGEQIDLITICEKILKSKYGKKWRDTEISFKNIHKAIKELEKALTLKSNQLFL